jgi:hypothetical protein
VQGRDDQPAGGGELRNRRVVTLQGARRYPVTHRVSPALRPKLLSRPGLLPHHGLDLAITITDTAVDMDMNMMRLPAELVHMVLNAYFNSLHAEAEKSSKDRALVRCKPAWSSVEPLSLVSRTIRQQTIQAWYRTLLITEDWKNRVDWGLLSKINDLPK